MRLLGRKLSRILLPLLTGFRSLRVKPTEVNPIIVAMDKIKGEDIQEIVGLCENTRAKIKIALILGISPTYLSLLLNGKRPWRGNLKERYLELVNTFVNNTTRVQREKETATDTVMGDNGLEPLTSCV
jgi:hypothetical protein